MPSEAEIVEFKALLAPWVENLVSRPEEISKLIETFGSPLHISNTDTFLENIKLFKEALGTISSRIFYARKANKLSCFVETAIKNGCGIDCGSEAELRDSLLLGAVPESLFISAAIKDKSLIEHSVISDVCISLDNFDELELCETVAQENSKKAKVAIRISDFNSSVSNSRFGFPYSSIADVIARVLRSSFLELEGLHFHLNGYSLEERSFALDCCLDLSSSIKTFGVVLKFIDIGGGVPISYLPDESSVLRFEQQLISALIGDRPPITINNNGLGFYVDSNKTVCGKLNLYPFFHPLPKNLYVQTLLANKSRTGRTVADEIFFQNLELRLELGRSLLDQCGCTLAKVVFRKQLSSGDWLVGLKMNFTNLLTSSSDFLVDPVLIKFNENEGDKFDCFLVGDFCLERDFIYKRKIRLEKKPNIGDVLLIPNTAGYFMHFHETEGHSRKLPTNIKIVSYDRSFLVEKLTS